MNRRSKAGSGAVKKRHRKPSAPKAAGRRGLPTVGGETETSRLTRELDEARESVRHRANWNQCSTRYWKTQLGFARPGLVT
jgi:hypothetical protein